MDKFTIVIPVYNEAKNLVILIPKIYRELRNMKFELIIVDDNSNDGTSEVLKKFKKKNFQHIIRKKERDLSKSCIDGFKKARFKKIIVMDGDLQHKPSDIKKILNAFSKGNPDFVVGTRNLFKNKNHNLNFLRLFASRMLILIVNFLLGRKTSDPMSGFFMFKKEVFSKS
ncbi:MAG: glycosyltransferase, partial [Pseudomonadota bacterium]|nr:glycosyltransferase [Pseudomonadota bacterium]